MQEPIIIIGIGEMAGVFARGFLKTGYPVFPVTRETDIQAMARDIPNPALVLIAVGENDLHPTLEQIPTEWHEHIALLQNELLPRDWQQHNLQSPTVISVWFEKKKGQDYKVLIPSPTYGPAANILCNALNAIDIPARTCETSDDLAFELVRKNVYILTTNIAGLQVGGNVDELWNQHRDLAQTVANEVIDIQEWLTGNTFDRQALVDGMVEGIEGDLQHMCMGRSAPGRLARALKFADEAGIAAPTLREIQEKYVH
jgi:hypothetical protein